jgi:hypothetical protein
MKRGNLHGGNKLAAGYVFVVLVVVLLGVRSQRTVATVLDPGRSAEVQAMSSPGADLIAAVGRREALLAAAAAPARDPFQEPPAARPTPPPRPPREAQPARAPHPVLQAIIHDQLGPMIQLRVGAQTSGWLREGATFEGWRVGPIGADSVRLDRDGKQYQFKMQ